MFPPSGLLDPKRSPLIFSHELAEFSIFLNLVVQLLSQQSVPVLVGIIVVLVTVANFRGVVGHFL